MKRLLSKFSKLLPLLAFILLPLVLVTSARASVTPESVTQWFSMYLTSAMLIVGIVWKFFPAFKNFTNAVIPWLNVLVGILPGVIQLLTPPAHAALSPEAGAAVVSFGDVVFRAFVHSAVATTLWEVFGRNLLHGILGLKQPSAAQ